jgi:hypothetical protein
MDFSIDSKYFDYISNIETPHHATCAPATPQPITPSHPSNPPNSLNPAGWDVVAWWIWGKVWWRMRLDGQITGKQLINYNIAGA